MIRSLVSHRSECQDPVRKQSPRERSVRGVEAGSPRKDVEEQASREHGCRLDASGTELPRSRETKGAGVTRVKTPLMTCREWLVWDGGSDLTGRCENESGAQPAGFQPQLSSFLRPPYLNSIPNTLFLKTLLHRCQSFRRLLQELRQRLPCDAGPTEARPRCSPPACLDMSLRNCPPQGGMATENVSVPDVSQRHVP